MKSFSNQEHFYKRLRELSNVDAPTRSKGLEHQTLVEYSRASDGSALGIIKEDSSFYIKSSTSSGDIGVEHFTYIGGLENKLKYKFDTLAEAVKIKNFYVTTLNEAYETKYSPAKTLNEEKELLAKTNADKGGIASMQDKADKETKGETLKTSAPEKDITDTISKSGAADSQKLGDANKSDDSSAKLQQGHEASATSSGAARGDIAKAQGTADAEHKGSFATKAPEKQITDITAQTGGASQAQKVADTNKSNDASGKLTTSTPKEVEPASDAKKEKAIVVENFGEEETEVAPELPGAGSPVDAAATAAGSAEGIPSAGGDETADLDAAASALDALDIKADAGAASPVGDAGGVPPIGGDASAVSAEVPSGDVPTAGAEAGGDGGVPTDASAEGGSPDDAALKDVEKLVGKTGQKIRAAELSDEMVAGFLKSLITSFDGKLANLDSDIKRELSNKILKAGEEGEESNGSPESVTPASADGASSTAPKADSAPEGSVDAGGEEEVPGDQEIEEAINAHLAEMGMADQGGVGAAPQAGAEDPNSFKKYMAERGYEGQGLNEVSVMEMVSLVNGYANECGDDYSKADMQTIAEYMSPEVKQGVTECGYGRFAEGVNIFSVKPKKYKSQEPIVEVAVEEEVEKVEEKKDITFAPPAESLNKAEKEKAEEKKEEKKEDVSESAKTKLRAIINAKIQEQLGLKKPSINEAAKSEFSKKLDAMIAEELIKGKEALKLRRENAKK